MNDICADFVTNPHGYGLNKGSGSKQLTMYVPGNIHKAIKMKCVEKGMTIKSLGCSIITSYIEDRSETGKKLLRGYKENTTKEGQASMPGLRELRAASHRRHLSGRPLFEEPFQRPVRRDHHGWAMRGGQRDPVRMDADHRAAPLFEPARELPQESADEVLEDKPRWWTEENC